MFAFGLCVDRRYLLPSLVTLTSLADSLTPRNRAQAAVRVLTPDLSRGEARLMADLAKRAGFGSFRLRRQSPPSGAVMADTAYITDTAYLRFGFDTRFVDRPYLIYVDGDTLALDDISTPLASLPPGQLGVVHDDFNPAIGHSKALPGLAEDQPHLLGRPYYNGGMWWLATALLPHIHAGVRTALRTGARYIFHNDQDALNLWALNRWTQDGTEVLHRVPDRFNTFELGRFLERSNWVRRYTQRPAERSDAALVHYVGSQKPWLRSCPPTPDVRLYRTCLARTVRQLDRLGHHSVDGDEFAEAS
ncbi:glycosyltransferase [Streptomyces sp. NPDC089795]|uniref:glycosyltransferase family 8 protein n=1 Tax=Streptomyces sp. NPDC089795 TaxID=3155297 RepID=UPI00343834D0